MLKDCKIHGTTDYGFRTNRWRCRKCEYSAMKKRRYKVKALLKEKHGNRCSRCGYNKCMKALSFHHLDRATKSFGVSGTTVLSLDRMLAEADKCVLLCMNCHMEVEEEIYNRSVAQIAVQGVDNAQGEGASPSASTS